MSVVIVVLFVAAPLTVDLVGADFDPSTKALYVELFRLMCVTPILFAATIVVGEVLVAHRQFLFYALAPMFYTGGIILGTVLFHASLGIHATALGAVGGAVAHLAVRTVGLLRTPFRIRPRLGDPDPRLPRVHPPDAAADDQPPDRSADAHLLHPSRLVGRGRGRRRLQLRVGLPGRAGQPDRRVVLPGGLPDPRRGLRRGRRPDVPAGPRGGTS